MQINPPVASLFGEQMNRVRAERIATQQCCDSDTLKGIATVVAVIAIIIFGALLIIEWPALLLPAALVTGIWAFDCLRARGLCCC